MGSFSGAFRTEIGQEIEDRMEELRPQVDAGSRRPAREEIQTRRQYHKKKKGQSDEYTVNGTNALTIDDYNQAR